MLKEVFVLTVLISSIFGKCGYITDKNMYQKVKWYADKTNKNGGTEIGIGSYYELKDANILIIKYINNDQIDNMGQYVFGKWLENQTEIMTELKESYDIAHIVNFPDEDDNSQIDQSLINYRTSDDDLKKNDMNSSCINNIARLGSFFMMFKYKRDFKNLIIQDIFKQHNLFYKFDLCYKLLKSVEYFNTKGYAHFNLKPENFWMMNDYTPVLANFEYAQKQNKQFMMRAFDDEPFRKLVRYVDPEINTTYDMRADVYSLGVILYDVSIGNPLEKKIFENSDLDKGNNDFLVIITELIKEMTSSLKEYIIKDKRPSITKAITMLVDLLPKILNKIKEEENNQNLKLEEILEIELNKEEEFYKKNYEEVNLKFAIEYQKFNERFEERKKIYRDILKKKNLIII